MDFSIVLIENFPPFSLRLKVRFSSEMSCLEAKHCCFCFSLRTGGLILSWIGAVCSALGFLLNLSGSKAYYEGLRLRSQIHSKFSPESDLILSGTYNNIDSIVFSLLFFIST